MTERRIILLKTGKKTNIYLVMEKGLREYAFFVIEVIKRGRYFFAIFFIAVAAYCSSVTFLVTPLYKTTVEIDNPVQPMLISSLDDKGGGRATVLIERETFHRSETRFLLSREFIKRVFDKLPLDVRASLETHPTPLQELARSITVDLVASTDIFVITVVSPIAEHCAIIADILVDEYKDSVVERYRTSVQKLSDELENNILPKLKAQLAQLKEEKADFLSALGFADLSGIREIRNTTMIMWRDIIKDLTRIEQDVMKYKNIKTQIEITVPVEEDYLQLARILVDAGDTHLSGLLGRKEQYERQLEELRLLKKPKQRELYDLKRKIESADKAIIDSVKEYSKFLENKLQFLEGEHKTLSKLKESLDAQVVEINKKLLRIDTLSSEIDTLMQQYNYYQKLAGDAALSQQVSQPRIRILKKAEIPIAPYKPDVKLNIILSSIFVVVGGIGVCMVTYSLSGFIKDAGEVQGLFNCNVLSFIPLIKARDEKELFIGGDKDHEFIEPFKKLEVEVDFITKKTGHKVFTIISAIPGDGKTITVFNLATVCAMRGLKVLVIDADLRRPYLHRFSAKHFEKGLELYLEGVIQPEEVITPTTVNNVFLAASKGGCSDSERLLRQEKFESLIAYGKANFDIVIIDTPAILPASDGCIAAKTSDTSLVVLRADNTRRIHMRSLKQKLDNFGINCGGVILNGVEAATLLYPYYSYYSSYYYQSENKKRRRSRGPWLLAGLIRLFRRGK